MPEPSGLKQAKGDRWVPLVLAGSFLVVYLRTLCPTVYLGDDGEICTAIVTGGVIHPPGYPLFSLLARLALILIPYGEPAFRIGCLVAVAAAATVGVLYRLGRELGVSSWAAAFGASFLGASHTFWNQSTRVEVYSLHTLLVCLSLLLALRYHRTGARHDLAGISLAVSLGLAHHLTIVLIGPALLVLCGTRLWTEPGLGRRLLPPGLLLLIGPVSYLLLGFWASSKPLQSWGSPTTLPLLWNHASARVYGCLLHLPSRAEWSHGLTRAGSLYWDNFPAIAGLIPLLGMMALYRRDRRVALGLLLAMVTVTGFDLCYQIDDIAPYYLVVWMVGAALLALGLDRLTAIARRSRLALYSVAAVGPLLIICLLVRNGKACDLSRATWVREFARQKLESTDPGGVLISSGDDDTFPLWYAHDVLHIRPDVYHVDRTMASGVWSNADRDPSLWYLQRLRLQGVPVPVRYPSDAVTQRYLASDGYLIDRLKHELKGRPIFSTFFNSRAPRSKDGRVFFRWAASHYEILPQGIILRLQPRTQPVVLAQLLRRNQRLWDQIVLPDLHTACADQDLDPDYLKNHYACMLVNYAGLREMAGDREGAAVLYRRVIAWAPGYAPAARCLSLLLQSGRRLSSRARRQALDRSFETRRNMAVAGEQRPSSFSGRRSSA